MGRWYEDWTAALRDLQNACLNDSDDEFNRIGELERKLTQFQADALKSKSTSRARKYLNDLGALLAAVQSSPDASTRLQSFARVCEELIQKRGGRGAAAQFDVPSTSPKHL